MRLESLREGAMLAIDQLRSNKVRALLTILGIVVGVATVMIMSAVIAGVRKSIMDEVEAAGPQNFFVARFDFTTAQISTMGRRPWEENPPVTIEEIERLKGTPGTRQVVAAIDGTGEVSFGGNRISGAPVWARGAGWSNFTTGTFVAGHDFQPSDVMAARPVIVISRPLAEELFADLDPIGRRVRVRAASNIGIAPGVGDRTAVFTVIGVFDMSRNIFANMLKHWAIVPYTAAVKHLDYTDELMAAIVVTAQRASQSEAMDQVTTRLRTMRALRPGEENNFTIMRQEQAFSSFTRITNVFFLVMLALSSVGLMVGGVGVVAIMMIAVTERTREIGVRKALGATRREILWQFLFESMTVTFIGAVIGMMLGGSIAFLISVTTPLPARVPFGAIVAALAMAAVAGIVFGMWPAVRASRLDPVVALRYE